MIIIYGIFFAVVRDCIEFVRRRRGGLGGGGWRRRLEDGVPSLRRPLIVTAAVSCGSN